MKRTLLNLSGIIALLLVVALITSSCGNKKDMKTQFTEFTKKFNSSYDSLYTEMCTAYWAAENTGNPEDYSKSAALEFEISKLLSNKTDFELLKKIKESGEITEEVMKRELDVLYNMFLAQQIDTALSKQIIDLQSGIGQKFNTFRAIVGTDTLTDNEVEHLLSTSTDSKQLQDVWEAAKKIGPVAEADIKQLVKLRNEAAVKLGFKNYHEMSLKLSGQDPAEIDKLFNELDSLTRDAFAALKSEMDAYFAKRYKIPADQLRPWHYQNRFFQEAPAIYAVELDKYYADKDLVKLTDEYYKTAGIDISDIIKNSDLFEREGKCQHAFCIDINKKGDVRVLCNVKPNCNWMGTMLHEYGHAAYAKYTDPSLPFVLRDAAHIFTTEAVAMFFGRLSKNPEWMKAMGLIDDAEMQKIAGDCNNTLRLEQLTFSRWSQVMYRFEKSLYENPDQDLNKLWWELVQKYQMLTPAEGRNMPDWATKIHIASSPCYYHNYLLGELLASQFTYYITEKINKADNWKTQSFTNNPEMGKWFIEKVFAPGMKYEWNTMIEKATGEKLTAKYYAKQFVE